MAKSNPLTLGVKHVARVQAKRSITQAFGANSLLGTLVSAAIFYLIRKK